MIFADGRPFLGKPPGRRPLFALLASALVLVGGCARGPRDVRYLENGKQFLAKKDYARAALQFQGAIQANPKNAEAQYQYAVAEIALGDGIAAYRALAKTLDLDPKHMAAQLKMAELLTSAADPEHLKEAQQHAQAVLDASPDNPDALDAMAFAELKLGRRQQAVQLLEQAGRKAPDHLKTAAMLLSLRLAQKDNAGAERVLKEAIAKTQGSLQGRLILGAFYLVVEKNREGEQELRKVLEQDPNNELALTDLASLFDSLGRKDEAQEMYRRLAAVPASPHQGEYGSYLFRIGKQKEAVAEFERLAKANPNDVNARTRLVAAYLATKSVADAHGILEAALKKNPKDTAALLQRSELGIMAGSYQDARKDLNQILHSTPDSATAHFMLASVYRAEGIPLQQRQELLEALRLNPHFFAARVALTQSYLAERQSQSALDLMDKTPDDQRGALGFVEYRNWALLGSGDLKELHKGIDQGLARARTRNLLLQDALLKLQQKNESAARSSLLEILNSDPEDPAAVNALLRCYATKRQLPAAIDEVRMLLSKRLNSPTLHFHLGTLLAANGQRNDARAAFTAALRGDRQFAPARMALATMDQNEGKFDAARQELDPLLTSKATELPARMDLAVVETKAGRYTKAIEHLRKIVEAEPNNVFALNFLAYLLADHSDKTDEALKHAQKAKELAPDDIFVEDTIGWAYFKKGMYGPALQHLQGAVNREGKDVVDGTAVRRYHLAMAYKRTGNKQKAAETLDSALKLDPNLPEARVATQMLADSK